MSSGDVGGVVVPPLRRQVDDCGRAPELRSTHVPIVSSVDFDSLVGEIGSAAERRG